MRTTQRHLQVLDIGPDGDFELPASQLLPWADPYIAQLMGQTSMKDAEELDYDEPWDCNELEPDVIEWQPAADPAYPPVYGGWPLLNDLPALSPR